MFVFDIKRKTSKLKIIKKKNKKNYFTKKINRKLLKRILNEEEKPNDGKFSKVIFFLRNSHHPSRNEAFVNYLIISQSFVLCFFLLNNR